jgi:hypothetical protein
MTDEQAKEIRTLSWWTWRQRKYKRRGELEQHKVLLLNKLGFVWDPHAGPGPGKWLKNYTLLKEFKVSFALVTIAISPLIYCFTSYALFMLLSPSSGKAWTRQGSYQRWRV